MTASKQSLLTMALLAGCMCAWGGADTETMRKESASATSGSAAAADAAGRAPRESLAPGNVVTMTWVTDTHRFATVDGSFHAIGDTLSNGAELVAIDRGVVTVSHQGQLHRLNIVDEPPPLVAADGGNAAGQPLSYVDEAIGKLQRIVDTLAGDAEAEPYVKQLEALKQRLEAGREALANGTLNPQQQAELEQELNVEWLAAQRSLDALRERIVQAGGGLTHDQLVETQRILEAATLSTLSEPLAKLQNPVFQGLMTHQSGELLKTVADLLGSFPDYQALADRLNGSGGAQ